MTQIKKAIIIGGGPAGLAAAVRLKTFNSIETIVYELRPEPSSLGGALNIPPNGIRLMQRLGVYEDLASCGSIASRFILHSMRSSTLLDMERLSGASAQEGGVFMRALRSDVLEVLLAVAEKQAISIHYGKRVVAIDEASEGVTVRFSDNTTDSADLLLGCDGIHSGVRQLLVDPAAVPEYTGISNMFSILPAARLSGKDTVVSAAFHGTLTPEGMLGVTPCTASGDRLYWFYSHEVPLPNSEQDRDGWATFAKSEVNGFKENLFRILKEASGLWADQLRDIINKTEFIKFYPIYRMPPASTWSTKRCLLLGDAAHAMSPHSGQGTSQALEDVFLLSRLLQHDARPLKDIFAEYERIRRPRVEAIARAATENGNMWKNTSRFQLKLKETAIGTDFWLYSAFGLQRWGIGMKEGDFTYDIMDVPIWP